VTGIRRLLGKFAIVTGGSSGIGAALAAEGAAVLATGRRFAPGPPRPPGLGEVVQAHLDVTDEAEVRARFAELPELDIVVCSAGVGMFAPVLHTKVDLLRAMLEVHVVGTMLCAREALRRMQPRRKGHIVAIGSHAAQRAFADCAGYTAAKAGQLGFVRVLAEEARPYDVRVTNLLPGASTGPRCCSRPTSRASWSRSSRGRGSRSRRSRSPRPRGRCSVPGDCLRHVCEQHPQLGQLLVASLALHFFPYRRVLASLNILA